MKINSEQITNLDVKCKTIKFLGKWRKFLRSRTRQRVLRLDNNITIHKEKIDKLDLIKTETYWFAKVSVKKVRR